MILALAPAPSPAWRGLAAMATAVFAWRPLYEIIWSKGRRAIRRIEWSKADFWRVWDATGSQTVELLPESTVLGPLVFLVWTCNGSRRYAVIDSTCIDPRVFRALRGRLRLEGSAIWHGRADHTC